MNGASMLVVPSSFVGGYELVRSYVSPPSWFSRRKGYSEYSNGGYSLNECRDEGGEEAATYEPGYPDHDRA